MKPERLEEEMRRKCRADVEFASMTYAERSRQLKHEAQMRRTLRVIFFFVGLICGVGSAMDVVMLLAFGILGPIAMRYEMFW
jgi:hypothetical protein